jgi:hypothetical protein
MKVLIKPVPGRLIRMHDRGFAPVPEEGAEVESTNPEYARAIAKGDVLVAELPQAQAATPPKPTAVVTAAPTKQGD